MSLPGSLIVCCQEDVSTISLKYEMKVMGGLIELPLYICINEYQNSRHADSLKTLGKSRGKSHILSRGGFPRGMPKFSKILQVYINN